MTEKINVLYRSILDATDGILCQQVNCQNVMGAGLAKAIYGRYPAVKELYHKRCERYATQKERSAALYGHYQLIKVSDTLMVANIFSQDKFGNGPKRGIRFTNPEYLVGAIKKIAEQFPDKTVYVPEKIGCGFGGGNWTEIHEMIESLNLSNICIVENRENAWERGESLQDFVSERD